MVPLYATGVDSFLGLRLLRFFKLGIYFGRIYDFVNLVLANTLHSRKELLLNIQKALRFLILLILTIHLLAWIWIYLGKSEPDSGWIQQESGLLNNPDSHVDLYIASVYWVMTTFTTVGYGDLKGHTNSENLFQMFTIFLGIGFFGYIIGNINGMIDQVDTLDELQTEQFEQYNMWQMRLGRANKDKTLSSDYYDQINQFFAFYWKLDYHKLKHNELFNQLKPRLQNQVADICFENVYNKFDGFFSDTEHNFMRDVVHNLTFEDHRLFPPYCEIYKDDKWSYPQKQRNILLSKGKLF